MKAEVEILQQTDMNSIKMAGIAQNWQKCLFSIVVPQVRMKMREKVK